MRWVRAGNLSESIECAVFSVDRQPKSKGWHGLFMPHDNDPSKEIPNASTVRRVRLYIGVFCLIVAILWVAAAVFLNTQMWPLALILGGYGAYLLLKPVKERK